jgi:hypothetical protein
LGILLVCAVALVGCVEPPRPVVPVSGRVTQGGKPIAGATVSFQPAIEKGQDFGIGSYGKTDDRGRFTLRLVDNDEPGDIVGSHVVTISLSQPGQGDDAVLREDFLLPVKFYDGSLRFTVPAEGTAAANFELP